MRNSDAFKRGKISKSHKVTLDLNAVQSLLAKHAGESTVKQVNVQDKPEIEPISNVGKSQMGHEEKLSLEDPTAPSVGTGATMGKEPNDIVPTDSPTVPHGSGEMGHESEQGYTSEGGNEMTGGDKGAGNSKAAKLDKQTVKTSGMVNDLANRIIKSAEKVNEAKPVADDEDVAPISKNEDHPHTPEGSKIKPFESSDHAETDSVPEAGSGAYMGHEEESIGAVPKAPEHQPDIPSGGGSNANYDKNDKYSPEKQENIKGTVIAGGDEESLATRRAEAIKVAARMLQAQMIKADAMPAKVAELERYEVPQIQDFERAMFGVVEKGLDTVARGTEKPLVISESSNRRDAGMELTAQIQSLFRLDGENRLAAEDEIAQMRRLR